MTQAAPLLHLALRLGGAITLGIATWAKSLGLSSSYTASNPLVSFGAGTGVPMLDHLEIVLLASLAIWIALGIRTRVVASFAALYCGTHFLLIGQSPFPGTTTHGAMAFQNAIYLTGLATSAALAVVGGGGLSLIRRGWSGFL